MNTVHPTAIVSDDAQLARGVEIGPFAIVGPGCEIGEGCVLAPRATLERNVKLGRKVRVGIGAVLGGDPQDLKFQGEETSVEVGEGTDQVVGLRVSESADLVCGGVAQLVRAAES